LARQGLAWCTGTLATALAQGAAPAAVPAPLTAVTVQAAIGIAAHEVAGAFSATAAALTTGGFRVMFASKVKVAVAVLVTVSALGVGRGVSQHASPGGRHAGAGPVAALGARLADGRQLPFDDSPAFGRYYAGGFHSLRGFTFRGVALKAGSPVGGCEKPDTLGRESQDNRVEPPEQPTGSLLFGTGVNSDAGLKGGIVLNEGNFDLLLPPASYDELFRAGAFRGAGQEFRIEPVPGPVEGKKFGGDFWFLNGIDYQVPVRANDGIFRDSFGSGGTVRQKVEIKDYRVSAGFGVRLAIPMLGPAPIALDSPFPSVKPSEPEQLFNFWIGFFS
jgi:hypothetical protein